MFIPGLSQTTSVTRRSCSRGISLEATTFQRQFGRNICTVLTHAPGRGVGPGERPAAACGGGLPTVTKQVQQLDHVIIRFAGDSGDGMQLAGDRFTQETAVFGNDLSTLPNFPAEIRAPAGTLPGVSSFQLHFADHDILTPGDAPNVLVAMNPAALKANIAKKPQIAEANLTAFRAGWNFGETTEDFAVSYEVAPAATAFPPGTYRNISGNLALAYGLIAASRQADLPLFLGSYPITPASDILHELSRHKNFGGRTFQAEDEIAGIGAALGESFGGSLAVTTTCGPGVALKSETIGLAVSLELPLLVIDIQRGGPSTG